MGKPGSLIMIKGFPCKVTDTTTAKPGKHGSAKVILKGKDILTDKVYDSLSTLVIWLMPHSSRELSIHSLTLKKVVNLVLLMLEWVPRYDLIGGDFDTDHSKVQNSIE